jgi:L-asparaginase
MDASKTITFGSNSNKPKLFISYRQEPESTDAKLINDLFTDTCSVIYDKETLHLRDDLDRYMRLIQTSDIVVLIISEQYMKSMNCIYEVSLLMGLDGWEQKVVIIGPGNSDVFSYESIHRFTSYWQCKVEKYKSDFREDVSTKEEKEELRKYEKVAECISPFVRYIKNHIIADKYEGIDEIKRMVQKIENDRVDASPDSSYVDTTALLEKTSIKNVYIVRKGVDHIGDDEFQNLFEEYNNNFIQSPVCVIYTGGSAGEIRELEGDMQSALRQADLGELINKLHNLSSLQHDVHFYKLDVTINSANISSKDWMSLAKVIENIYEHYSGFVIIHGSHTIAYTASALSFMFSNLTKPIILTGSELPLDVDKTDAPTNIMRSLSLINSKYHINEVCIFYGNELLRGNRTTKKKALDINQAFYSPNCRPLACMESSEPSFSVTFPGRKGKQIVFSKLPTETKILIIEITPDMNNSTMELILKKIYWNAVIIRTFGLGEISNNMIDVLKKYISDGGIVVSIPKSQISENCTDLTSIEKCVDLYDMGVVIGGDIVPEAAYCKVVYLMGKYGYDTEKIKAEIPVNISGELSVSMHNARVENCYLDPIKNILEIKRIKFVVPFTPDQKTRSITIRLTALKVFDNFDDTVLSFSFYTDERKNNCVFSYERRFVARPSSLSLIFEIKNKNVNMFIDEKNNNEFSLFVSTNHTLQIGTVSVIAFVEEDVQ